MSINTHSLCFTFLGNYFQHNLGHDIIEKNDFLARVTLTSQYEVSWLPKNIQSGQQSLNVDSVWRSFEYNRLYKGLWRIVIQIVQVCQQNIAIQPYHSKWLQAMLESEAQGTTPAYFFGSDRCADEQGDRGRGEGLWHSNVPLMFHRVGLR